MCYCPECSLRERVIAFTNWGKSWTCYMLDLYVRMFFCMCVHVHVCSHDCVYAHACVHVCKLWFCSFVAQKSSPGVILSLCLSPALIHQQILQPSFPALLGAWAHPMTSSATRWLCLCRDKCLLLFGLLLFAIADCFNTNPVWSSKQKAEPSVTPQTHSGTPLLISRLTRWRCHHCHCLPCPCPALLASSPDPHETYVWCPRCQLRPKCQPSVS